MGNEGRRPDFLLRWDGRIGRNYQQVEGGERRGRQLIEADKRYYVVCDEYLRDIFVCFLFIAWG